MFNTLQQLKGGTMDVIQTIAAVMHDHEVRLDRCDTIPLRRRPHKPRARPNTAIITRAAQEAYSRRCAVDGVEA